jgi:hypothetical protein
VSRYLRIARETKPPDIHPSPHEINEISPLESRVVDSPLALRNEKNEENEECPAVTRPDLLTLQDQIRTALDVEPADFDRKRYDDLWERWHARQTDESTP